MSRRLSLLALLCGVGVILTLLISLAGRDLNRLSADSSLEDLRHSISYQSGSVGKQPDKQQLLAFIGVQVSMRACSGAWYAMVAVQCDQFLSTTIDRLHHQHRS